MQWDPRRESVLAQFERQVQVFCLSQLRNEADADDAAQETYIRFLRCREDIHNVEAWLIHAAQCACRDVLRRRAKHRASELSNLVPLADGDPADAVVRMHSVPELLGMLCEADRTLLDALYVRGLSVPEVAALLHVSVGNVWIMTMRAKRRAAEIFRRAGVVIGGVLFLPLLRRFAAGGDGPLRRLQRAGAEPAMAQAFSLVGAVSQFIIVPAAMLAIVAGGASPALSGAAAPPRLAGSSGSGAAAGVASLQAPANVPPPGSAVAERGSGTALSPSVPPAYGPVGVVGYAVAPNQNPQEQDAEFQSITPSPNYTRDHTVFATGSLLMGCYGFCPVLFRTQDGGATWQHVAGNGFLGGPILLPPDYPSDPTIFAASPAGLEQSDTAGSSFRVVVPGFGPAAVDPGSPARAPRVLIASAPLLWYSAAQGTVSPGPVLPPATESVTSVVFTGPDAFVLTGFRADPLYPSGDSVVIRCDATCSVVASIPGGGTMWLVGSPFLVSDGTLAAYSGNRVLISHDGGRSFSDRQVHLPGTMLSLALAPRGPLAELVAGWQAGTAPFSISVSTDEGASFAPPRGSHLSGLTLGELVVLPDGNWMAAAVINDARGNFGLRCSVDQGATWTHSC
ncbi:MAG: sigma factor [Candidatus Dormibacteria bacterium]